MSYSGGIQVQKANLAPRHLFKLRGKRQNGKRSSGFDGYCGLAGDRRKLEYVQAI